MAHWRDHLDSPLLGAYSLFDDATEKFKTIDGFILRCADEMHILGASGKRKCLVAYTSLSKEKPMKINVTIASKLAAGTGSQNPEKWVNVPVTFYVDERVSSKDGIVAALRVRFRNLAPQKTLEQAKKAFDLVASRETFVAAMVEYKEFMQNSEILELCKKLAEKYPNNKTKTDENL